MKTLDLSSKVFGRVRNAVINTRSPKWLISPEYAIRFHANWHKAYEQMPNIRPPVVYHGALKADLQGRLDPVFPETGVLELSNARLYGQAGWVFSTEGYLLCDHSWYGQHVNEMPPVPRFLPNGRRIKGVCLSISSDFALGNYAHFLLDCVGRLHLFQKTGFKLSDIDHIFCPRPPSKGAQDLFDQLGIPISKCIWANENHVVHVETLLAPSFPGTRRNYPKWLPAFLKQEFLPSSPLPSRRLYISRAGYGRTAVNEADITQILIQYGFEIYDPRQNSDKPYDFAEAAIIVAPHGGGLADLAFCQPGTKVLELIPTDHAYPYYYTLSDAADLEYGCLVCKSLDDRASDAWGPSPHDFYVNEEEFDSALAQITSDAKSK